MICKQLDITEEQMLALQSMRDKYFNSLNNNKFQSAAERLSEYRKLFDLAMCGFRCKNVADDLRRQADIVSLAGVQVAYLTAAARFIAELADCLNALEIEQQSNLKPLENGEEDVL